MAVGAPTRITKSPRRKSRIARTARPYPSAPHLCTSAPNRGTQRRVLGIEGVRAAVVVKCLAGVAATRGEIPEQRPRDRFVWLPPSSFPERRSRSRVVTESSPRRCLEVIGGQPLVVEAQGIARLRDRA